MDFVWGQNPVIKTGNKEGSSNGGKQVNSVTVAVKDLSARAIAGIVEGNLIDRGFHADRRSEEGDYYLVVVWRGAECRHIGVHKHNKNLVVIEGNNHKRNLTSEEVRLILEGHGGKEELLTVLWREVNKKGVFA